MINREVIEVSCFKRYPTISSVSLALLAVFAIAFVVSQLRDAEACPEVINPPERIYPPEWKGKVKPIATPLEPMMLGLVLPANVSQVSGFPRISSTWCCGAALYCDIDEADAYQEALMPCTAESMHDAYPQVHRCYDSIWVMKAGGINALNFPVTLNGHPCSCMAAADVDGDGGPEIFIGSDINPPSGAKAPDSRVYGFNSDGSRVTGFPKDLECGPIPGGICLTDLGEGDSDPEILFGTRGWEVSSVPYPGKITALDEDGTEIEDWITTGSFQVRNSPAVGDLIDDEENFPGKEVVFQVLSYCNTMEGYKYQSQLMAFKNDGTLLDTYDLGDVNSGPGMSQSSPAIGKILSYVNEDIVSNIVACSSKNEEGEGSAQAGKIWVFHLVPDGSDAEITLDWSYSATAQTCVDDEDNTLYDEIHSDPAIADLDNDSQNEIVVHSDFGTLYVVDYSAGFNVYSTDTMTCGGDFFRLASPLISDVDSTHTTLEIIVTNHAIFYPDDRYVKVYGYSGGVFNCLHSIGPFAGAIEMTPAIGDIDNDTKTDMVLQPMNHGYIYCLEFDQSTYSSAGWPCMGKDAARTHCAD